MGQEYRAALAFYRPLDTSPQLDVDRRVRGIDRKPADLIDEIVTAALTHKQVTLTQIETATRRLEQRILFALVGVMSGAVLLLIWLVDHTIGQPIAITGLDHNPGQAFGGAGVSPAWRAGRPPPA